MEAAGTGALSKVMSVQLQKGILNAGDDSCLALGQFTP